MHGNILLQHIHNCCHDSKLLPPPLQLQPIALCCCRCCTVLSSPWSCAAAAAPPVLCSLRKHVDSSLHQRRPKCPLSALVCCCGCAHYQLAGCWRVSIPCRTAQQHSDTGADTVGCTVSVMLQQHDVFTEAQLPSAWLLCCWCCAPCSTTHKIRLTPTIYSTAKCTFVCTAFAASGQWKHMPTTPHTSRFVPGHPPPPSTVYAHPFMQVLKQLRPMLPYTAHLQVCPCSPSTSRHSVHTPLHASVTTVMLYVVIHVIRHTICQQVCPSSPSTSRHFLLALSSG